MAPGSLHPVEWRATKKAFNTGAFLFIVYYIGTDSNQLICQPQSNWVGTRNFLALI